MNAARHRHLTPAMRDTLRRARSQPLRRVHDGKPGAPPWPASANTLYSLLRHGYMHGSCRRSRKGHGIEEWSITDDGLRALEVKTVQKHRGPLLLAEGWPDFTRDPARALRGEPGVLPADEPEWLKHAA